MIEVTVEADIGRPPAHVFAYVTDPAKLPTWQTNTVSSVPEDGGPVRLGSRLREVHRAPGGKEMPSLVEVSEYERDRVFALHVLEGALPLDARITFEPAGEGTHMTFAVHGRPTGAMRLAQPVLRRVLERQFAAQCAELKRVLEGDLQ